MSVSTLTFERIQELWLANNGTQGFYQDFAHAIEKEVLAQREPEWKCSARTANMGANDPLDCNWPFCGCDPYAEKVLSALAESQIPVIAGEAEKIADWLESKDATYAASLIRRWYMTGIGVQSNDHRG
jgi:hypothetical protein